MSAPGAARRERLRDGVAVLLLLALTFAVFLPVAHYPFTGFDDDIELLDNPWVRQGLTLGGLRWAMTATSDALWTPLTWLSRMLDVQLFGLNAGAHHLANVALHACSVALLYAALAAATGARAPSALVAALFAVHPLHVESVVWISERKDTLSGLFWMLALGAHVRHARRPGAGRYALLVALFALGLMAKPMLVTLPLALLLLDVWPLGRLRLGRRAAPPGAPRRVAVLAEKVPLLALAAGAAAMAVLSQARHGGAFEAGGPPVIARAANACVSYGWYLLKTLLPTRLAVFYPHPGAAVDVAALAGAAALLAALSWAAARSWPRSPALAVGWLWYLVTLAPVAGFLVIGPFARADRYAYLPLIGVFVMAAWGVPALLPPRALAPPRRRAAAAVCAAGIVLACAVAARVQLGWWRDDETLFGRALAVTENNWMMHGNLGASLLEQGRLPEAVTHLRAALRHNPDFLEARLNLAQALDLGGDAAGAGRELAEAARRRPGDGRVHFVLGRLFVRAGRTDEAIASFREALRLDPASLGARAGLADALEAAGRPGEAAAVRATAPVTPP